MPTIIPVKAIFTTGDTTALGEFGPTDIVPVGNLPLIDDLGGVEQSVFNDHIFTDVNPHSITPVLIGAIPTAEKGVANGVATLDGGGKIPAGQIPAIAIPSLHVVANPAARLALTVQEGDEAKQLDDGSHWIYDGTTWHMYPQGSGGSVYGTEFQNEVVSGPQSTTNSTNTSYLTAATLNTTVLPAGEYRMTWSYGWNHNNTSNDFEAEFRLDGGTIVENHRQEPKDSSGGFGITGTDQKHYIFRETYAILSGSHTVDLRFRTTSSTDGYTSSIWDVIITIMRVV